MDNYETYGATVGNSYESHGYMQNLDGYQQHVKYSNYRDYQINPSMALWDMIKAPSLSIYLPKQMNSQENQHNSINKEYQTYSGPNSVEESRSGSSGLDTSPTIHHSLYSNRSAANSSPTSAPPHQSVLVVPQPVKTSMPNNPTTNGTGRKYQCKMCPQVVFGSKADMQLHTQIHMREPKPYKCSQCSKSFANSSYLSQHTRIHLGIKPYRCEMCQRKFTQLSHLQQHIRTHTGDKPYKCRHAGCSKQFSQLSNLQSHSRCHQTDKPYKCNSCYKCFVDETALLDHIPKHKESKHLKTHICQFCGKSYTQETYLAKHMQKHSDRPDKRSSGSSSASSSSASSVAAANAAVAVSAAAAAAGLIGRSPGNGAGVGPESHYGWNSTSSANNNSTNNQANNNNNSNNNPNSNNSASGVNGSNRDSTSSNNSATNGTSSSNSSPTKVNGSNGSNGPGASPDLHELSHSHPHHPHHPHHGHHHSQGPTHHHPPPGLNQVTHHHQSNSCLLGSPLSSSNDIASRFHHSRSDVDGHRHGPTSSTGSANSQHHSANNSMNTSTGTSGGIGGGVNGNVNTQPAPTNGHNGSSDDILSYGVDIKPVSSASAFTPIQSATMLSNARNAAVAAAYFPYDTFSFAKPGTGPVHGMEIKSSMEAKSSGHNSFPNQLIALHQIRNYASMPNSAASIAGDHRILKDKSS